MKVNWGATTELLSYTTKNSTYKPKQGRKFLALILEEVDESFKEREIDEIMSKYDLRLINEEPNEKRKK